MRTEQFVSAVLVVFIFAGGAVASVKTSHKEKIDFSKYRSYSWREWPNLHPDHPLAEGSPLDQVVKEIANKELARQGFELVTDGDPDLWMTYTAFVQDSVTVEGTKHEITSGVSWIGDPQAHAMLYYQEGTLVFEVYDASNEVQVWSGWAVEVADTREKLRKKGKKAIPKIFRHFPPR